MPDRCEVLPGDSVVARRGGGLLWVDAPGSPALVAALHACLGVAGPGADRVLAAVAGQVCPARRRPGVLRPRARRHRRRLRLRRRAVVAARASRPWTACRSPGRRSTAAPSPPASRWARRSTSAPASRPPRCPRASRSTWSRAPSPAPARCCSSAAAAAAVGRRPAGHAAAQRRSFTAGSDAGFGDSRPGRRRSRSARSASRPRSGGREPPAAPVLRFDDGMVVTVDEDLVLGRRPDGHDLVTSGSARAGPDRRHPERAVLRARRASSAPAGRSR